MNKPERSGRPKKLAVWRNVFTRWKSSSMRVATPPVIARPNRFWLRISAMPPRLRSGGALSSAFDAGLVPVAIHLEPVAEPPRRVLLHRHARAHLLDALDRLAEWHELDVHRPEHVGIEEPLARQRPLLQVYRAADRQAQRAAHDAVACSGRADRLDVLQHLLRALDDRQVHVHLLVVVDRGGGRIHLRGVVAQRAIPLVHALARGIEGGQGVRRAGLERERSLGGRRMLLGEAGPVNLADRRARAFLDRHRQHALAVLEDRRADRRRSRSGSLRCAGTS